MGTVTYRGMPVKGGTIHFVPQANDRSSIAAKTDAQGRFRVIGDASGRPLTAGRYRVHIDFPEYGKNRKSELRKSELMVELRPKSADQFDFDLQ